MAAFAGIVRFDGAEFDADAADRIGRAVTALRSGRVQWRRAPGALFALRANPPDIGSPSVLLSDRGDTLFAALGRLHNRTELRSALGLALADLAKSADAALLKPMLERWGDDGVARCLGAFVFAHWDPEKRRLTLGRDCVGFNHTLFFYRGRDFAAFATTLVGLLSLPFVPRQIDEIALANFMAVNMRQGPRTFYRDVERVPSRMMVTLDSGRTHRRHFWSPDLAAPPPYRRDADYIARARELFDEVVATATAGRREIASALSGGLDSSSVVATAARLGQVERVTCYTLVPPPGAVSIPLPSRYQDETDKVQALGRLYPQLDLNFVMPEAPHRFECDDTSYFAASGTPAHGGANLGWFAGMYDAVAAAGHRAFAQGEFGNYGLTWHGAGVLPALLRRGEWRSFVNELGAFAAERDHSRGRAFVSHILIANGPAALRRLAHRLCGRDPDSIARYSALNPTFIADQGLPRRWREEGFDPWFRRNWWNPAHRRAAWLFDTQQVARDFFATLEERYGFETLNPHMDRRLLEFALSVPEPLYRRDGVPRWFARQVFADRLPREIIEEQRLGAQGGAWFRRMDVRRRDIAADVERLEASPLASRMLDLPRLKRLVDDWPDEDGALRRMDDYKNVLFRGVHFGRFIRWVEGGNA